MRRRAPDPAIWRGAAASRPSVRSPTLLDDGGHQIVCGLAMASFADCWPASAFWISVPIAVRHLVVVGGDEAVVGVLGLLQDRRPRSARLLDLGIGQDRQPDRQPAGIDHLPLLHVRCRDRTRSASPPAPGSCRSWRSSRHRCRRSRPCRRGRPAAARPPSLPTIFEARRVLRRLPHERPVHHHRGVAGEKTLVASLMPT